MNNISLAALQENIDKDVAQEFIEYRNSMEKRYHLKTQGQFDRQMKKALKSSDVGMSPTELIEWTMDKNWVGININYTATALSREMVAITEASQRPAKYGAIQHESTRTRDQAISKQLTATSWAD
jgi:hypothetical protein